MRLFDAEAEWDVGQEPRAEFSPGTVFVIHTVGPRTICVLDPSQPTGKAWVPRSAVLRPGDSVYMRMSSNHVLWRGFQGEKMKFGTGYNFVVLSVDGAFFTTTLYPARWAPGTTPRPFILPASPKFLI